MIYGDPSVLQGELQVNEGIKLYITVWNYHMVFCSSVVYSVLHSCRGWKCVYIQYIYFVPN